MNKPLNLILLCFIIVVFSYIAFLTVLPGMLDSKIDSSKLKKDIFLITKMDVEFKNPEFYTTKDLNVGIKFKEVDIEYPDDKDYLEAAKIEIEFAVLPLLTKTVKITKVELFSPKLDLITLENRKLKIVDYLEGQFGLEVLTSAFPKLRTGTLILPKVTLLNYTFIKTDVNTGKIQTLKGATEVYDKNTVIAIVKPFLTAKDDSKSVRLK